MASFEKLKSSKLITARSCSAEPDSIDGCTGPHALRLTSKMEMVASTWFGTYTHVVAGSRWSTCVGEAASQPGVGAVSLAAKSQAASPAEARQSKSSTRSG